MVKNGCRYALYWRSGMVGILIIQLFFAGSVVLILIQMLHRVVVNLTGWV